jgi:cytochrome c-type biogenesis protein CcmH
MMLRRLLFALLLIGSPAFAVQPDEMLTDPVLETRARAISANLRCPVCQGETIDDSNAPISRDLRLAVRERLMAGDDDEAVVDYVVDRYGEFVLFLPRAQGSSLILWLAGPAMLLLGAGVAFGMSRKRASAPEAQALSDEDKRRLADLLKK